MHIQKRKIPIETNIKFIRHGESEANVGGYLAGQMDAELTDNGEEQARDAGRSLRDMGASFDAIVSSPQPRAKRTAEIVAGEIGYDGPIFTMEELKERNGGDFQGNSIEDFYGASDNDIVKAGGESVSDFSKRVSRGMTLVGAQAVGNILVVGHAEAYRMMKAVADGKDINDYEKIPKPRNAQVYEFPRKKSDIRLHKRIAKAASRIK